MPWEGLNRRRFPRASFPCLLKLIVAGRATDAVLTHTENISVGGVCVIIKRQFDLFAPASLEIDLMDGEDLITSEGKVVWVVRRKATEANKPSFYDTGIEFTNITEPSRARMARAVEYIMRGQNKANI